MSGNKLDGVVELKVGDDVLIAEKRTDCIGLFHFKITSLYLEDNCELVYKKNIYDLSNINFKNHMYKSFIKDFLSSSNVQNDVEFTNNTNSKVRTLFLTKRINNKLVIEQQSSEKRCIFVYSNGVMSKNNLVELKVGDDIFVVNRKVGYYIFVHFKMISLYDENNCNYVYSRRIYNIKNLNIENPLYTSIINQAICEMN